MGEYGEPTIEIAIEGRVPGGDWEACFPASQEFVYTYPELCRVVSTYMLTAVRLLAPGRLEYFRVVVRELTTHGLLATWEWKYCPTAGQYLPPGEPWFHWPDTAELPDSILLGSARHGAQKEAQPPTRFLALVAYAGADQAARAAFARQAAAQAALRTAA